MVVFIAVPSTTVAWPHMMISSANNKVYITNSHPTITELHNILKTMTSNAAPDPDGLNATFYKSSWNLVKMMFLIWLTIFIHLLPFLMISTKLLLLLSLKRTNL
jgi:hypothetical protein